MARHAALIRPGLHRQTLRVGQVERRYLVHVPPSVKPSEPMPLVVFLHGAGGTARWALAETGLDAKADHEGFLLALPEGTPADPSRPARFQTNPLVWNDGAPRSPLPRRQVDDVGFIEKLLGELQQALPVDRERIYVAGFSNGGGLAFAVAAHLSEQIAAVAAVAAHCWIEPPQLRRAIPTVMLVGTSDPLFPLEGGAIQTPWGARGNRPALDVTLARWSRALGCLPDPSMREERRGIERIAYRTAAAVFLVYLIEGLGHHWPGGAGKLSERWAGPRSDAVRANDLIWDFFQARLSN